MTPDIRRGLVRTSLGHLHYREAGAGPAIVLLHINQQSSELFLEMMAALAPTMRAVAIDYPSHGGSDHVASQPTLQDYARCVREVMRALDIRETVALGEATGAAVCVELANAYPGFVRAVVMVNCPFLGDAAMRAALLEEMKHQLRPADETGFPKLRTMAHLLETGRAHV